MKKLLMIAFVLLFMVQLAWAEFLRDPIVTSTDGIWTDLRAYSSLSSLIDSIGINNQTIYIKDDVSITSDLTIPENVELKFFPGGKLSIDNSSATVTFNGTISAGSFRIFEGNGTLGGIPNNEFVFSTWYNGTSLTVDWTTTSYGTSSGRIDSLNATLLGDYYNSTSVYNKTEINSYFTNGTLQLEQLGNVNSSMSPGDGDVLYWNATLGVWDKFSGASATTLASLSDVNGSMTPSGGEALFYNGTNNLWDAQILSLGTLSDVADMTPTDKQVLVYNGTTGKWNASSSVNNASYATTATMLDGGFKASTTPAVNTCPGTNSTSTKIHSSWLFPVRNCTTDLNSTLFNASVGDVIILGQNNTCNLPASPTFGDMVFFKPGGDWTLDGNNATIQGNGNKVGNSTETILELDLLRGFTCTWNGDFWGLD